MPTHALRFLRESGGETEASIVGNDPCLAPSLECLGAPAPPHPAPPPRGQLPTCLSCRSEESS